MYSDNLCSGSGGADSNFRVELKTRGEREGARKKEGWLDVKTGVDEKEISSSQCTTNQVKDGKVVQAVL